MNRLEDGHIDIATRSCEKIALPFSHSYTALLDSSSANSTYFRALTLVISTMVCNFACFR